MEALPDEVWARVVAVFRYKQQARDLACVAKWASVQVRALPLAPPPTPPPADPLPTHRVMEDYSDSNRDLDSSPLTSHSSWDTVPHVLLSSPRSLGGSPSLSPRY